MTTKSIQFKRYEVAAEYPRVKNKKAAAILITEDNVDEFIDEYPIFQRFTEDSNVLIFGFMKLTNFPIWVIDIHPYAQRKKYILEHDKEFQKYFKEIPEIEKKKTRKRKNENRSDRTGV